MIVFNPADPFPLLELNSYNYKEAQDHSVLVDDWLGFNIDKVEENIRTQQKVTHCSLPQQNWEHLSVQAMQTPYIELRNILQLLDLNDGGHIIDLGCAYARMGFVIGALYPEMHFAGFELEALRVLEAKKNLAPWSYTNVQVHTADLASSSFQMPEAEAYFIFDYGSEQAVRKTLFDLQRVARRRQIQVVARGKLVRFWIHKEHPWLAEVEPPRHFSHFSIYQS